MGDEELWNNIGVARKCSVSWDGMQGDEQVRHCRKCKKNVYNIAAMTREEAELLLRSNESAQCIRLYRRLDGTVVTSDCPPALALVSPLLMLGGTAGAALAATFIFSALVSQEPVMGMKVCKEKKMNAIFFSKDCKAGRRLTLADFELRPIVENEHMLKFAVSSPEQLIGKKLKIDVLAGQLATKEAVEK